MGQQRVPRQMPEAIVVGLEPVQVEHRHEQGRRRLMAIGQGLIEGTLHLTAVPQAGQRVGYRVPIVRPPTAVRSRGKVHVARAITSSTAALARTTPTAPTW